MSKGHLDNRECFYSICFGSYRKYTLNHVTNLTSTVSVSPIKYHSTECPFLRSGTVSKWINYFVNKTKLLLWTFKPQNKRKPYLCLHIFIKKAPRIAWILGLNSYCFPIHQWSIALIYEWLVDFSHFWHYNPKLFLYNKYEVSRRQESWFSWKTTERLIRLRNLRNLNTEISFDSSHFVICFSTHLAI